MKLFIDIETFGIPPAPPEMPTKDDVKLGNLKDPLKIEAKIKESLPILQAEAWEKHEQEWRKNALSSLKCNIITVAYAFDNNPPESFNIEGTPAEIELETMSQLNDLLKSVAPEHVTMEIIAHNGMAFDYPYLAHRGLKYGFKYLYETFNVTRYDTRAKDTMVMFRMSDYRSYYSLNAILEYFGFGQKTDHGSQVHDMFLQGQIDKINEYCRNDVKLLQQVYNTLTQF